MKTYKKVTPPEKRTDINDLKISRKEALKKSGLMVLSAATMVILLSNPAKAQTSSPANPPPWG